MRMWERDREWHCVDTLLRTIEGGAAGTLLVDGEPGAGRTRLLTEAARAAGERHIRVLQGGPGELGELIPCGMLYQALDLRFEPAAGGDPGDSRARTLERLRSGLEERATGPVLVVLDDLHWADPMTLMVLRALHHVLAARPIGWLLSRSTAVEQGQAAFLFDLLEREGAARVELAPLSPEAVVGLMTETLGAPPEPALLALAGGAGGNPLLISELLAGLRDEGRLGAGAEGGGLPHAYVPHRLRMVVRHWIDALSAGARNLVETVAVLGRSLSPEQAASLLGTTPAALLPLVEECMAAGILAATPQGLAFRHELVRLVVATRVPQPVRHALLDQLGARTQAEPANRPGDVYAEPAGQLPDVYSGAADRSPDAYTEPASRSPGVSSSGPSSGSGPGPGPSSSSGPSSGPGHFPGGPSSSPGHTPGLGPDLGPSLGLGNGHLAGLIDAAIVGGRLQEAERLVNGGLADRDPAANVAELRCLLADILYLTGRIDEALRQAETVLAVPDLPGHVRDRAVLVRLYALTRLRDSGTAAREYAYEVLEGGARHGPAAQIAALVALTVTEWEAGRLSEALAFAEDARRLAVTDERPAGTDEPPMHPYDSLLVSAALLMDIHRLDEARAILREARADMSADGHLTWTADASALEARAELAAGRFADAVTEAERALDLATALGTPLPAMVANAVLATVALRRGDLRAASRYVADGAGSPLDGHPRHALLTAQVAEIRDGPLSAMTLLADLSAPSGQSDLSASRRQPDLSAPSGLADSLAPRGLANSAAPRGQPDPPVPRGQADLPAPHGLADPPAPDGEAGISAALGLADSPAQRGRLRSMLAVDPIASAWMVRVALAADDRPAAEAVVATAEALSEANPGFAALVASAAHARGLLDGDCDALAQAAGRTDDGWARASAVEDLGVALLAAGRPEEAAGDLDRALAIYQDIGSVRDSARVRQRLRGMGVRHRHWSYAERPVSGWDSLTETERNISLLVADGWTNRRIAEQTFISVHTVAFHLRHVYRKLQINSRIELVRLVVSQGRVEPGPSGVAGA
ncbi:helix-turn-helix transcriptional regulator [Nonomuraea aurantiaca]|uniref:helix-turn-helix transcriptional regulator n=1 Tax=Nonomuraea aurantiaca TaxID=2878562 RepID=UPI001CDA296B|nr:helix-turn-helix transcriptional regulator [Nonomuraea aurantiaca]MCA2226025.1 AAA family ATPase [Nonomuraea aurantiaca]